MAQYRVKTGRHYGWPKKMGGEIVTGAAEAMIPFLDKVEPLPLPSEFPSRAKLEKANITDFHALELSFADGSHTLTDKQVIEVQAAVQVAIQAVAEMPSGD